MKAIATNTNRVVRMQATMLRWSTPGVEMGAGATSASRPGKTRAANSSRLTRRRSPISAMRAMRFADCTIGSW